MKPQTFAGLGDIDTIESSLYAKGPTTGEINAHFTEIYAASLSTPSPGRSPRPALVHADLLHGVVRVWPLELRSRGIALRLLCAPGITATSDQCFIDDELGFARSTTPVQLLSRFVAAGYEPRSLGVGSHWPFESWGRFRPEHTTAVSMLDRLLHHCHTVITDGESYRMRESRTEEGAAQGPPDQPARWGLPPGRQRGPQLGMDRSVPAPW